MKQTLNIPRLLLEIIATIALAETGVMFLLPVIAPGVGELLEAVLDATLLALISGPIILWRVRAASLAASPKASGRVRPIRALVTASVVLVLGLLLTFFAVLGTNTEVNHEATARFEQLTERLATETQRRVNRVANGLMGLQGLYAAADPVNRASFERFVEAVYVRAEFPGALGLGFIQRVPRRDLEAFVAAERADGAPDFEVRSFASGWSDAPRPDLCVVKHIYPLGSNLQAWGLDLGSEPIRRAAIEHAIRDGRPAITPRVPLVQDAGRRAGFLYLLPIYAHGATPATPEEREAALIGVAYAPMLLDDALDRIAATFDQCLDFEIFDGDQLRREKLLFDLDGQLSASSGPAAGPIDLRLYASRSFRTQSPLSIGGRRWTLVTSSTPKFESSIDRTIPVLIGATGALSSLLLAACFLTLGLSRGHAVSLAQEMTSELREANSRFELAAAELESAKASLEEAQSLARLGNWSYDLASGKVHWSRQVFALFGRDPALGPPDYAGVLSDYHPESAPVLDRAVQHAVADATPYTLVLRTSKPESGVRFVRGEGRARRDEAGRVIGLFGTVADVTAEVEREEALRHARLKAEAASQAKSAFLANMSHEIRTPLTAILGFTDLLRDDGDMAAAPPHRVQAIDTIRNAGAHLLTVINDILDLSKIEADKLVIERVETSFPTLLSEVAGLLHPRAVGKGLALKTVLLTPVPERIVSDPTRLRQILMNLVGNAIKFTEVGDVAISVRAQKSRLIIEIEDTGPGMSPDQVHNLFRAFGQADDTVTRRHGGTGLGLIICRRLAGLMGGAVSLLRTEPGRGSTFQVDLPLVPAPDAPLVASLDAVIQPAQPATDAPRLQGRILLAEDGVDNQRLISFHLRRAGATVVIAENGRAALDLLEPHGTHDASFDLLLTDIQMPEMDGYSLIRTLRARGVTMPIIALTAHAMLEDERRCLEVGCNAYASKPIDRLRLIQTCAAWMPVAKAA